ncbi:MAG: glycosyltransferase family 39 protein [Chloroflexi bacterium]|jgi:hypothetical protein|nr:glycosyltransferase family 39 protein [Chloroflexota bacterium]
MQVNPLKRWSTVFGVLLAVELGSLVRLLPVALHEYPLNDGGMFYRMTQDLVSNGLRLPVMTSYNGGGIPFAYPPLGFYLAACLHLATEASLLEITRWLPALISIMTILPFFILAQRLLGRTDLATIAAIVFALIPRSHTWMVMGGGLARSPGMLFSMLSILQAARLLERPTWKRASILGLLLALVTLSHLEMAWYTYITLLVLWIFRGKTRITFGGFALASAIAAALSGFWWLPVAMNHGIGPFVEAALTGNHTWTSGLAILSNFSDEPSLGVFVVLGFLGALLCVAKGDFLLPVWMFSMFFLDPRAAATDATAPLAMLVALAVTHVVIPPLVQSARPSDATQVQLPSPGSSMTVISGRTRNIVVSGLVAYGLYSALLAPFLAWSSIVALRPGEVDAMHWIDNNVAASSDFLVISGRSRWGSDPLSEWFPALTHAVSLATPQGKEWTGGLWDAEKRYLALQVCSARGLPCVEEWVEQGMTRVDYVLVAAYPDSSAIQSAALLDELGASPEYEMVYANPEATVFSYRPANSR